jgi:predicted hotdog family 3-hydroxylacyl-ACP dehydratase
MNLLKKPFLNNQEVRSLIPQKTPFVMIDKMYYFSGDKVVSGFTISEENIFSFNSLFTASGLIENMAQTVALHTGYQYFLKNEPAPIGYIGAIKKVEIMEFPKVNDSLKTTVFIVHEIMGFTIVKCQVACNGKIIATSEMKTVLA